MASIGMCGCDVLVQRVIVVLVAAGKRPGFVSTGVLLRAVHGYRLSL